MPFTPGTPRPAGSGRKAGTPNRSTVQAQRIADEMGVDPFRVLLMFAAGDVEGLGMQPYVDTRGQQRQPHVPSEVRVQAAIAATKHLYPTLKAAEITGANGGPLEAFLAMTPDELAAREADLALALSEE